MARWKRNQMASSRSCKRRLWTASSPMATTLAAAGGAANASRRVRAWMRW
jgi:hypothetical protein